MVRNITSRVIAVVLVSLVLTAIAPQLAKMPEPGPSGSYAGPLLTVALWLAGAIAVSEAIAYGIRAVWPAGKVVAKTATPVPAPAAPAVQEKKIEPPKPKPPTRSDAISLLAALQREARLIDFLKESIDNYPDAAIGAAVRDIHRESAKVLDRMFAIRPVLADSEGAEVEAPAGFDAARYKLTGNVRNEGPFRGQLVHHGWVATTCNVPTWTGSDASALVLAPAEIELK